jgi:hypothetical protein
VEKKKPSNAKNSGMRRSHASDRATPLRLVHAILGSILTVAGAIKLYELCFEGPDEGPTSWLLMVFAEAEFFGGLWMVGGIDPLRSHPWAVVAFAGFAASSFLQAFAGSCSCGCLGSLSVSPWYALVFDLAAVAVLLRCHPFVDPEAMSSEYPLRLIGLGLIPLIIVAGGWRQSGLVTVAGTAMVGDHPLEDATITFSGVSGGIILHTTKDGNFHLPCVRPGRYTVSRQGRSQVPEPERADRGVTKKPARRSRRQPTHSIPPVVPSSSLWIEISKRCEYNRLLKF